jgi:hypothetical protein
MLEQIEQDIHYTLSATVIQAEKSHQAVMSLNELYQQWLSYLQQFQRVIFLLGLTVNLWRNVTPKFR